MRQDREKFEPSAPQLGLKLGSGLILLNLLDVMLIIIIILLPSNLPFNVLRVILVIPFLLFLPGYTLTTAIFPRKEEIGGVERVLLSSGLSVVVVSLIGLILNYTPWGIRLEPILYTVASLILLASIIAWLRQGRLTKHERLVTKLNLKLPSLGENVKTRVLTITLILAILGALGALVYIAVIPRGETFTEFYILGQQGKSGDYPEKLKVGDEGRVIVGIINHERMEVRYSLEVVMGGNTAAFLGPVMLVDGQDWQGEVGFTAKVPGESEKVEIVLYKDGGIEPYKKLHLWVDIETNAASGSADDIQAAIDAVYAGGGGAVYIPEGDFALNGSVLIPDGISLIGAGIDNTILRTQGESMVIEAQGDNIRISGFSLISTNYDGEYGVWVEDCTDFRVDYLHIEGYYHAGVSINGIDTRGVIDHCEIRVRTGGPADNLGYGVEVMRNDFWEGDMKLGSAEATFIEDCVIVNARHAVCANEGAHYVFRHNLVQQGVLSHQVDAHGPGSWSAEGTRCVEIYNNVIENPSSGDLSAIGIRGGDGVIFNNIVSGYDYVAKLVIDYELELAPYPMYHQVRDMWIWNNDHDGLDEVVVGDGYMNYRSVDYIIEDRDYFLEVKPGYTPYTYPHPLVLNNSS